MQRTLRGRILEGVFEPDEPIELAESVEDEATVRALRALDRMIEWRHGPAERREPPAGRRPPQARRPADAT